MVAAVAATVLGPGPALASRRSAVRFVKARGYTPVNKDQYHKGQALRVLVGRKPFGCCALGRKAFFFVRHRGFERSDVQGASRTGVEVTRQGNKTIFLRYGQLYRQGDPYCCPSGGYKTVRFRWNGSKVKALDKVPSAQKRGALYMTAG
jgi:hypothetical protein